MLESKDGHAPSAITWKDCSACSGERFLRLNSRRSMLCPCCGGDGCIPVELPGYLDKLINKLWPEVK